MVCKLHTKEPGQPGHCVRTPRRGEVVGPTVGPAKRCATIFGDFVSVPVVGTRTEGPPYCLAEHLGPFDACPSPRPRRWGRMGHYVCPARC
eukprot:4591963-Pyramimonas_sp.AAC.1